MELAFAHIHGGWLVMLDLHWPERGLPAQGMKHVQLQEQVIDQPNFAQATWLL